MDSETVVLDSVERIEFPKNSPPTLNYQELYNLRAGMLWLRSQIIPVEQSLRQQGLVWGLGAPGYDESLLACFFHWFAVSLVNHCRLVGTMDFLCKRRLRDSALLDKKTAELSGKYANEYVKSVCPDVLVWRNKVSAHFALTDARPGDSIAAMRTGVTMNVGFDGQRFKTASLQWEGSALPKWSLSEEVERLAPRYWPTFEVSSPFTIGPT